MSSTALLVAGATKTFGGVRAVHDVTLSASGGEFLGLIGPNGAGKTTLFNIITGVVRPDGGTVRIVGEDVTGRAPAKIARKGVGRTFQLVQMFHSMTVLENVAVALMAAGSSKREAAYRASRVLAEVGLQDVAGEAPSELPFAIRRKVELARAMAAEPKILLADEVMAGLEDDEIREMASLLQRRANEGVCVVAVEHNLDFVMNSCSRVVVLHRGELLADGPPEDVAKDPAVVEAYVGAWHAEEGRAT